WITLSRRESSVNGSIRTARSTPSKLSRTRKRRRAALLKSPLTDSNRRPPPCHALRNGCPELPPRTSALLSRIDGRGATKSGWLQVIVQLSRLRALPLACRCLAPRPAPQMLRTDSVRRVAAHGEVVEPAEDVPPNARCARSAAAAWSGCMSEVLTLTYKVY